MAKFQAGAILEIDYSDGPGTLGIALRDGSTKNPERKTIPVLQPGQDAAGNTNGAPFRVVLSSGAFWAVVEFFTKAEILGKTVEKT